MIGRILSNNVRLQNVYVTSSSTIRQLLEVFLRRYR